MTELMKRYKGGVFKMNDFEKNMYQEIRMLREKFSILKLENSQLRARISELEEQLYERFDEQADMGAGK